MNYITGDTHGQFERIEVFCKRFGISKDDVMIILGDVGNQFQWRNPGYEGERVLESLLITIFAIHVNHEWGLQTIEGYQEKVWHGGVVYWEEEYSSLLFAKDREVFGLDGKKVIVMDGVCSIDKMV